MDQFSPHIEAETNTQQLWLIWDLDGNYKKMIHHLNKIWAIESNDLFEVATMPIWTGWNMKVIFSGDILADRKCDGFQILLALSELRKQAQEAWWDITILAGNHDERMIGYLAGRYDDIKWWVLLGSGWDHIGMTELEWFLYEADKNLIGKERRLKILQNMRKNAKWHIILQEICKMKLVHIDGNGIHFHTQPSLGMLDSIATVYKSHNNNMKGATDAINNTWNDILTRILLRWHEVLKYRSIYFNFANIFLHPLNGTEKNILPRINHKDRDNEKNKEVVKSITEVWSKNITPVDHPTYGYMLDAGMDSIYHGHTDDTSLKIKWIEVFTLNRRNMGGNRSMPEETLSKLAHVARAIIDILPGK